MKAFWWILAWGLVIAMAQYGMFRENGAPRQINFPAAVAR